MKYTKKIILSVTGIFFTMTTLVLAADEHAITIKEHKFYPEELKVASGTKIKLIIENQDNSAEEFESYDLNREKVVSPNGKITVFIGPLKPGTYAYFGDFNPETAQGRIMAE